MYGNGIFFLQIQDQTRLAHSQWLCILNLTLLYFGFNHEKFTPAPLRETTQTLLEGGGRCFLISCPYFFLTNNGLSEKWAVGAMGCRNNGPSEQWAVGIMTLIFILIGRIVSVLNKRVNMGSKSNVMVLADSLHHDDMRNIQQPNFA
jgi:hypothetical protein